MFGVLQMHATQNILPHRPFVIPMLMHAAQTILPHRPFVTPIYALNHNKIYIAASAPDNPHNV